jgi:hypothetical protein
VYVTGAVAGEHLNTQISREHSSYGEANALEKGEEVTEGAQNSEQGQGPLGGVTDQVGQVTQGVQDTGGRRWVR